jgi:hypothetical protein
VAEGKYLRFACVFALAGFAAFASDDGKSADTTAPKTVAVPTRAALPPVLQATEPSDSTFVMLPGPPAPKAFVEPPPPKPAPKVVDVAERLEPAPPELIDPGRPILRRAPKPFFPEEFERDSGIFCQKLIGQWSELDAMQLLGTPSGDRPSFDDDQKTNGRIYAFSDPTNRYRQLELDFDGESGTLRTVFVYPWKMTWQECRKLWGANVSAAEAAKGRKFYSYLNRRLDVLVDAAGKVISIGLY